MPQRPLDQEDLTHLGWQHQVQGASDDQDHLLLSDPGPHQPIDTQPLVEFVNEGLPVEELSADQRQQSADFLEVQDVAIESNSYHWGSINPQEHAVDQIDLQHMLSDAAVIFGLDEDSATDINIFT